MNDLNTFLTSVAFVGRPNAGKSTLLNALVDAKIAPTTRKPQTTRKIIRGIKTLGKYQHIYYDTPGSLKNSNELSGFMVNQIYSALHNVQQVAFLVDVKESIEINRSFLEQIDRFCQKENQNLILLLNKIDLLKDKGQLLNIIKEYAAIVPNCEIIPISASLKSGFDNLNKIINQHSKPGDFLFSDDEFTDATEREICEELIREKTMLELSDELPYKIAVQIELFDESQRQKDQKPIIHIEAIIYVERDSQKAIVIGKKGEQLKRIGTRARKELEHLLLCQVMLRLFVKVEKEWSKSAKSMKKIGF